jgi:hypothetical protein
MREVSVSGEGFVMVLRVSGYERPSLTSGADANWLRGEAERTLPGSFSGRSDVSLRTEELEAFRDDLAGAVEALEGEATLRHMEDEVGCHITLERGSGEFEAFIRKRVPATSCESPALGRISHTCVRRFVSSTSWSPTSPSKATRSRRFEVHISTLAHEGVLSRVSAVAAMQARSNPHGLSMQLSSR